MSQREREMLRLMSGREQSILGNPGDIPVVLELAACGRAKMTREGDCAVFQIAPLGELALRVDALVQALEK